MWSLLLGLVIAWLIITFVQRPVSYYVQAPVIGRPLEDDEDMLIAVGLASRTPARRSIMDSYRQGTPMVPGPVVVVPDPEPDYMPAASPQFLAPMPPPQSYVYTPGPTNMITVTPATPGLSGPAPFGPDTGPSPLTDQPATM
jgi:hypothetical protein